MKVCGVVVAMLPGQELGTCLVDRSSVNVGTIHGRPGCQAAGLVTGAGSSPTDGREWGGGPIVVAGVTTGHGGRESRPQGKGGQHVSREDIGMSGGCRR